MGRKAKRKVNNSESLVKGNIFGVTIIKEVFENELNK